MVSLWNTRDVKTGMYLCCIFITPITSVEQKTETLQTSEAYSKKLLIQWYIYRILNFWHTARQVVLITSYTYTLGAIFHYSSTDALHLHISFICICDNKYPARHCVLWQKYLKFIHSETEVHVLPSKQCGQDMLIAGVELFRVIWIILTDSQAGCNWWLTFFNSSARCTRCTEIETTINFKRNNYKNLNKQ